MFLPSACLYLSYKLIKIIIPAYFTITDKAGGKRFSKDFEEGNAKLQEFVKFFDKQNKTGPPLLEALSNADIFYEMQYKEVKIVANVSVGSVSCCVQVLVQTDKDCIIFNARNFSCVTFCSSYLNTE